MSIEKKPICVVIDTNIWMQDSNLLLKTVMGSALLYILRQSKGKIGLPEIIEEELTRNIVEKGIQAGKKENEKPLAAPGADTATTSTERYALDRPM